MTNARSGFRLRGRAALTVAVLGASFALAGCMEEGPVASAEPVNHSALFWDNLWTFRGTYVEMADGQTLPYPTDFPQLERIRYPEGDAPPHADVLEGANVTFEIDGRVLVQPAGAEAAEYYGT